MKGCYQGVCLLFEVRFKISDLKLQDSQDK